MAEPSVVCGDRWAVRCGERVPPLPVGRVATERVGTAVGTGAGLDGLLLVNRKGVSDRPGLPAADARDRETIHGTTRLPSRSHRAGNDCRPDPARPARTESFFYSSRPGENLNAPRREESLLPLHLRPGEHQH